MILRLSFVSCIFINILFTFNLYAEQATPDQRRLLDSITMQKRKRVYLFSYPKSGNTWCRYCIEFLSNRPTFRNFGPGHAAPTTRLNCPIGWLFGWNIDMTKTPLWKVHYIFEFQRFPHVDYQQDKLICIIRNPKEVLSRRLKRPVNTRDLDNKLAIDYFDDIQFYHNWPAKNKIFIYYEDLIEKPKETLKRALDFLEESDNRLEEFCNNYKKHKATSVKLYNTINISNTAGNYTHYYSSHINSDERGRLDHAMESRYPLLWHNYLARYAEKS